MKWCANKDLGLFLIRLALAAIFITAGWGKFAAMDQVAPMFQAMGLNEFIAWLVAAVELLGGIAMLLGVFVQYAGIALAIVMGFAIALVKWDMGFAASQIDFMLLASSLGVALIGAGRWSLGKHTCGDACGCANGTCGAGTQCDGCTDCAGGVCSGHEMR